MQKSEELRLLAFCVFWMKRLSGLSLRGSAGAVAISQHQPEHGKAFGESVSACYALSVTFGDSSPRGRAKVASLPAMTREGGACKFVTMPLRMGWVSPSCHCILPVAAGPQICHCEAPQEPWQSCGTVRNTGKPPANSLLPSGDCRVGLAAPPRNDKSEVRAILAMAGTYWQRLQGPLSHLR